MLRRTWATVIGEQELRESLYVCLKLLTCQKKWDGENTGMNFLDLML
jgi:hypothetical protein